VTSASNRNESLDLLRGVAILLVILIHTWQAAPGYFKVTNDLVGYGPYGVQLFFIISGYTMMLTFGKEVNANSVLAFYTRRLFRIVPLFWAVGLMYLARKGFRPNYFAPDGVSFSDVLLTFSLLQWLTPTSFNSVVPGGWSIAVELQFYLVFPLFIYLFRRVKGRQSIAPYVLVAFIYLVGQYAAQNLVLPALYPRYPESQKYLVDLYCFYWLPNQIICFSFGFILFEILEQRRIPVVGILLMMACTLPFSFGRIVAFLFLFSFFILSIGLRNSVFETLGRHSYSIYLFHFDFAAIPARLRSVIFVPAEIAVPLVALLSFCVSYYVTTPLIENRFIRKGKEISSRYFQNRAGPVNP
jgi:peptidoglycan/LPS O-acetylase OafA/YrhL